MWQALFELASESPDTPKIVVTEDLDTVILEYEDGSWGAWRWDWNNKQWHPQEGIELHPCDVAARDSL